MSRFEEMETLLRICRDRLMQVWYTPNAREMHERDELLRKISLLLAKPVKKEEVE